MKRLHQVLASCLALTASACCCVWCPSTDGLGVDWRLVLVADSIVPFAVSLGYFRYLEARHRARWEKHEALPMEAYRAMPTTASPVAHAPLAVVRAGLLSLLAWGASINAVLDALLLLGSPETRGHAGGASLAAAGLGVATILGLGTWGGLLGRAVLARLPKPRPLRRAALLLAALHTVVIVTILVEWTPLLHALATLVSERPAIATFQPSAGIEAAGAAVLAWPVLGVASGLAFWRAAREL